MGDGLNGESRAASACQGYAECKPLPERSGANLQVGCVWLVFESSKRDQTQRPFSGFRLPLSLASELAGGEQLIARNVRRNRGEREQDEGAANESYDVGVGGVDGLKAEG